MQVGRGGEGVGSKADCWKLGMDGEGVMVNGYVVHVWATGHNALS